MTVCRRLRQGAQSTVPVLMLTARATLDDKVTGFGEGAGIGLSMVKRICDRYGWQIKLESQEHEGTTVTVSFS